MELAVGDILQNAHVFHPGTSKPVDVRPAVEALFEELTARKVDYVLVGGVALLSYVEGRNTQDINLLIPVSQVAALDWNATVQDRDFGRALYRGVRVDLLLRSNPLFEHVATLERTTTEFHGRSISIATRVGLLLLKLYALPSLYRHGQLPRAALYEADIRMLLLGTSIDDQSLLRVLESHLSSSDVRELARILGEQREKRRF